MKKVHIVQSVTGSNHSKVVAAFEDYDIARIWVNSKKDEYGAILNKLRIISVELMDECPEIAKMVLNGE